VVIRGQNFDDGGRSLFTFVMFPICEPALRQRVYSAIRAHKLLDTQVVFVLLMPDLRVQFKGRDPIDGTQRGRPVDEHLLAERLVEVGGSMGGLALAVGI
jgi:hypothetical protein